MNSIQVIGFISNLMIVIGGSFFIIGIFGRKSKTIESLPSIERWAVKIGLSLTVSGAFFNVLNGMNPTISEVILDLGLGSVFVWAAHFHYKYFIGKNRE